MRNLIVLLICAMLVAGCAMPGAQKSGGTSGGTPKGGGNSGGGIQIPGTVASCVQSQSFSALAPGTLGKTTELTATVECAGGMSMVAKVDGKAVSTVPVASNASQQVKLGIPASSDGAHTVSVEIGGSEQFSSDWTVAPLGFSELSGLETDAFSFKEWRAVAVDIENPISAARVRAYVKTQQFSLQPNSNVLMEIRSDSGGNPGSLVTSVRQPIRVVTQTDNWVNFDPDEPVTLSPGRYWIVFKVEQTEEVNLVSDLVQLHYVTIDKTAPGNDHTRQMLLDVDPKSGLASETQWTALPYDKEYDVVLTSSK